MNLAKDLTARNGKGFSRSNLVYMRKFYLAFPICETVSHKLTWSHYFELLKCDNALEMQFYYKESIKECWKVRELKRQMKSCLFQRFALSTDKAGVLVLANEGHQVQTPQDIIRDPFVLEFAGLPKQKRYKESDLEKALKDHMEQFLLEMGRGFAFVGRQFPMQIGSRQFKVDLVFYKCSALNSVEFPTNSQLKKIGGGYYCWTEGYDTPNFAGAFAYCSSLESLILPTSINLIENAAFYGCSALLSISLDSSEVPTLDCTSQKKGKTDPSYHFAKTSDSFKILVPEDYLNQYKTASGWKLYSSILMGM